MRKFQDIEFRDNFIFFLVVIILISIFFTKDYLITVANDSSPTGTNFPSIFLVVRVSLAKPDISNKTICALFALCLPI